MLAELSVQPGETDGLVSNDGALSNDGLMSNDGETQRPADGQGATVSTVTDATPHTSATEK